MALKEVEEVANPLNPLNILALLSVGDLRQRRAPRLLRVQQAPRNQTLGVQEPPAHQDRVAEALAQLELLAVLVRPGPLVAPGALDPEILAQVSLGQMTRLDLV